MHAAKEHHSWSEARKRLIFEIQQRTSVPLRPIEKRRHASNFMHDLLFSYPDRNTVRQGERTMRQIVACAVCAIKDWIDDFYPCYMWKDPPASTVDASPCFECATSTLPHNAMVAQYTTSACCTHECRLFSQCAFLCRYW